MRLNRTILPLGALVISLGAGQLPADAAQRGEGRDRGHRERQGEARGRSRSPDDRGGASRERRDQREGRASQDNGRDDRRSGREKRGHESIRPSDRRDDYRGNAPRVFPNRPAYGRRYGVGIYPQVYFGWGSGYRYGAPYAGRVYGYAGPPVWDSRRYYGDVRLLVRPRDAQVFVDGYYAGLVDDFDGVFQRLTLEAGPHRIEIGAPGLEPRSFDIYVDPSRTVELHGDLFPERSY